MTGYERNVAVCTGISAILNVILNAALIPEFGVEGAAYSTAISMILWNIPLIFLVYKRLENYSTALGRIRLFRKA